MSLTTLRVSLLLILFCTTIHADAYAQSAARVRGDFSQDTSAKPSEEPRVSNEADALRAEEFYQRGEGLARRGDMRGALEALQEALKLYLRVYANSTPPGPPSPEVFARFRAEMAKQLAHAPETVVLYKRVGGLEGATDFEREQLEALRVHAQGFIESDVSRVILTGQEADTRAVITFKPEPGFTEEARQRNVHGTVRLRAVLAPDGEVRHIIVLKGLPAGITEKCIEAALRMKFTPAVKAGRPVSQFVTLEYNFNVF